MWAQRQVVQTGRAKILAQGAFNLTFISHNSLLHIFPKFLGINFHVLGSLQKNIYTYGTQYLLWAQWYTGVQLSSGVSAQPG